MEIRQKLVQGSSESMWSVINVQQANHFGTGIVCFCEIVPVFKC